MGKMIEAIEKINTEIQKMPEDRYRALIGEHILDCIITELDGEKVLQEKKTLDEVMEKIQGAAQKKAKGGVAIMEDSEVYAMALEYFGLNEQRKEKPQASAEKSIVVALDDFF